MKTILLFLLSVLLFANCSKSTEPEKTPAGYKRVSLSSKEFFKGDLSAFPGYEEWRTSGSRIDSNPGAPFRSAKAHARIEFKEARVIVTNDYEPHLRLLGSTQQDKECFRFKGEAEAFYGKDLADWDTYVSSMNIAPIDEVVYTGSLEQKGDNVEGDILVKTGANLVTVCYINSQNRIFWLSTGTYLYLSELIAAVKPGDTSQISDGWKQDSTYQAGFWVKRVWNDASFIPQERPPEPPFYFHPLFYELGMMSPVYAETTFCKRAVAH